MDILAIMWVNNGTAGKPGTAFNAPLIRIQYEHWFTVALLGTCIDFCLRDIRLGTDIKIKSVGHKIDGIIYTTDELLKLGAIEGARSFKGVSDNKYLDEEFKMPKSLQDMYSGLIRAVNYDDQRADKLQVIGILHLGLWIQFQGYINTRYEKDY
ncbi:12484_t:CDS:2 [Entrophospora sp. SA101]|nr:12484_t:CDS:2 [Entrophospora sp. SA101]